MRIHRNGFTLLELVISIVIIGLLASLALPRLYLMVERARMAEAYAMIGTIRSAMERYYLMNSGSYTGINIGNHAGDPCPDDWSPLGLANPSCSPNSHFRYRVYGGTTFIFPAVSGYYIGVGRNSFECTNCSPAVMSDFFISVPEVSGGTGVSSLFYCGYGYYAAVLGACT